MSVAHEDEAGALTGVFRTRKLCDDLHGTLNRFQEYLRDENALSEFRSIKRLSLLASVFLPHLLAVLLP